MTYNIRIMYLDWELRSMDGLNVKNSSLSSFMISLTVLKYYVLFVSPLQVHARVVKRSWRHFEPSILWNQKSENAFCAFPSKHNYDSKVVTH